MDSCKTLAKRLHLQAQWDLINDIFCLCGQIIRLSNNHKSLTGPEGFMR
jgi:hypothetical protein